MSARPSLAEIIAAVSAEHGLTEATIVGRARGPLVEAARRDVISLGARVGWRQAELRVALGHRTSSTISLVAAAARREDAIPSEAERRGRLLAELIGSTPPQVVVDPNLLVGEPQAGEGGEPPEPTPPPGGVRQDRLEELVGMFTVVVSRIDARLGQLSAAFAMIDATVGRLSFELASALAATPGGAEPALQEPDAELLAAAAAAAPAPVPPLGAAPFSLPKEVLVEGPLTATRAARLLRSRDYAVDEVAPDAWMVGTRRMSTAEMIAMAERTRERLLSQRRVA